MAWWNLFDFFRNSHNGRDPPPPPAPGSRPPAPTASNGGEALSSSSSGPLNSPGPQDPRTIYLRDDSSTENSTDAKILGLDDWEMLYSLRGTETSPHTYRFNLPIETPMIDLVRTKWLYPDIKHVEQIRSLVCGLPPAVSDSRLPALPPQCVEDILDFAGCNVSLNSETTHSACVSNGSTLYLESAPVESLLEKPVCRITFEIESHDQGWSGEPLETRQTYRNSFTWFRASLIKASDQETSEAAERSRAHEVWEEWTGGDFKILTNIQSSRTIKRHVVILDEEHDLVKQIRRGDKIALWASAIFPGWTNFVESASIRISIRT